MTLSIIDTFLETLDTCMLNSVLNKFTKVNYVRTGRMGYKNVEMLFSVYPDCTLQVYSPISDHSRSVICRSPLGRTVCLVCVVGLMILLELSNQKR